MTLAFWQAGNLTAAGRAVRDWARADPDRPAAHRFAARIYEDMGAIDLAAEAADRAAARAPEDADAWERVGRLRLRLMDRAAAITALERARELGPSVEALLDLALAYHLAGDLGGEVTATEQATHLDADVAGRLGRATPSRSPAPTACRPRSAPPSARSRSTATTPRSPTCSSACATPSRASSRPLDRLGRTVARPRGHGRAARGLDDRATWPEDAAAAPDRDAGRVRRPELGDLPRPRRAPGAQGRPDALGRASTGSSTRCPRA